MPFKYRDYQPPERRVLDAMNKQLAVPGHRPTTLYLRRHDFRAYQRAARRCQHFNRIEMMTEDNYFGRWVRCVEGRP